MFLTLFSVNENMNLNSVFKKFPIIQNHLLSHFNKKYEFIFGFIIFTLYKSKGIFKMRYKEHSQIINNLFKMDQINNNENNR